MLFLALFLAGVVWLIMLMFVRAEVDFRYRRQNQRDEIDLTIRALAGLLKFKLEIPSLQLSWEKGPELKIEQKAKSADTERVAESEARLRYFRWGFFYRVWPRIPGMLSLLKRTRAQFYRNIHCRAFEARVEIGYQDPMATAMAAGAFWAALGVAVAKLYQQVTVDLIRPQLTVVPQFQKPGFYCDFHGIFRVRIGHIIFAGLNLRHIFKRGRRR